MLSEMVLHWRAFSKRDWHKRRWHCYIVPFFRYNFKLLLRSTTFQWNPPESVVIMCLFRNFFFFFFKLNLFFLVNPFQVFCFQFFPPFLCWLMLKIVWIWWNWSDWQWIRHLNQWNGCAEWPEWSGIVGDFRWDNRTIATWTIFLKLLTFRWWFSGIKDQRWRIKSD